MCQASFTKKKFLRLDIKQRHKKLAEILKIIYERLLLKQYATNLYKQYNQLLHWTDFDYFESNNLKEISDKYHYHLSNAQINLKEHNLLPTLRTIDGSRSEKPFLDIAIYLDKMRSAFNVGNIIRTAEALRIGKIFFDEKTPFIDNEKVQKTSMGSYQITKCIKDFNLADLPKPFVGLDTSDNSTSLYDFIFPESFTLFLGNEEYGISDKILKELDFLIEIPMLGFKNSINVASAFAITASEIRRQKKTSISH
ncbi:MAG: TrmH family RNA methyltransferase [Parachlamydiales bacterium]|nr:TrmH family RNA methyltransferase [Parachlamydiales bacterium]